MGFLALPFAMTHEAVSDIYEATLSDGVTPAWYGEVKDYQWGEWIDYAFLLLLGGIPWQCYYQRVLSSQTSKRAQLLSYGGGLIALIMTAPSVLFGAVAKATDWEATGYGKIPRSPTELEKEICENNGTCIVDDTKLVLPLCLQYLTPAPVAFFGL